MTPSGMTDSTEEATVYVSDLNVFVTMMLLEDAPEVPYQGLLCDELLLCMEKGKCPSLMKDEKYRVPV